MDGFYVFDELDKITASHNNIGCSVSSFEISPASLDVEMPKANCTTNPCRDIIIKKYDVISSPDRYEFKVLITALDGTKTIVDQSVEIVCMDYSSTITKADSMITSW